MTSRGVRGLVASTACAVAGLVWLGVASSATALPNFTVSGTVSEGACPADEICEKLPAGYRLVVAVDQGTRIGTVRVGQDGRFSITLPEGRYTLTPGALGANRDTSLPIHWAVLDKTITLQGDTSVSFSWDIYTPEPPPVATLKLGSTLSDVPVKSVSVLHEPTTSGGRGSGDGAGPRLVKIVTTDLRDFPALYRADRTLMKFPRATLIIYHEGTHDPHLRVVFYDVEFAGLQRIGNDHYIEFQFRAERDTYERL